MHVLAADAPLSLNYTHTKRLRDIQTFFKSPMPYFYEGLHSVAVGQYLCLKALVF